MLETVTIPILLKAVEFLFGEGSKILQERRERRRKQQVSQQKRSDVPLPSSTKNDISSGIQTKADALDQLSKPKKVR